MNVNHKIFIDLTRREETTPIDVVQDEKYSRTMELGLRMGFSPWCPPEDAAVLVRYRKPDGTCGEYDTLPDGTGAYSISGNNVCVALAPQVLTAEGAVDLNITLISGAQELTVYQGQLNVSGKLPQSEESEDYFNITGFIPQPETAAVGQYLEISEVDENGKIRAVRAVEAPTVSGAEVPENVVVCDLEGATEDESTVPVNADTLGGELPSAYARTDITGAYCSAYFPEDLSLTTTSSTLWPMDVSNQIGDFFEAADGVLICKKACVAEGAFSVFLYNSFSTNDIVYAEIYMNDANVTRAQMAVQMSGGPYTTLPAIMRAQTFAVGDTLSIKIRNTTASRGLMKKYGVTSFAYIKILAEVSE